MNVAARLMRRLWWISIRFADGATTLDHSYPLLFLWTAELDLVGSDREYDVFRSVSCFFTVSTEYNVISPVYMSGLIKFRYIIVFLLIVIGDDDNNDHNQQWRWWCNGDGGDNDDDDDDDVNLYDNHPTAMFSLKFNFESSQLFHTATNLLNNHHQNDNSDYQNLIIIIIPRQCPFL